MTRYKLIQDNDLDQEVCCSLGRWSVLRGRTRFKAWLAGTSSFRWTNEAASPSFDLLVRVWGRG